MSESDARGRNLRRDIVFAFALALACYVAWLIREVLVLLYVSALLAVVLRPVVVAVSRIRIGSRQPQSSARPRQFAVIARRPTPRSTTLCSN